MYDENYALLRASRALTVFIILIVLRNKYLYNKKYSDKTMC
jgi:hypothetical protein